MANNKIINQALIANGTGRIKNSLVDQVVLTRQINEPDLIFNQCRTKDAYFELDACENWQLSTKAECFVCQKHRFTIIFYKNEKLFEKMPNVDRPEDEE